MNLLGQYSLEPLYWLTLYVNLYANYGMLCILIAAILKKVAILELTIPEMNFMGQNTLESMCWLTLYVNL